MQWLKKPWVWVMLAALGLAGWAGWRGGEVWVVERMPLDPATVERMVEAGGGGERFIAPTESRLWGMVGGRTAVAPAVAAENVVVRGDDGEEVRHFTLRARSHRGGWSLFPAGVTILLCFLTRRPALSLMAGVVVGALVLGGEGVRSAVPMPQRASGGAALILVFYLVCLGGLMGVWSRNGAAAAFAKWVTRRFVRGPRTAKLAAWALGVVFFQGGAPSTLLVGTAVKPIADAEKVSHEELAYIVDSTASPVAILLPFNAWPFYVQGLIFVGGVGALATESARVGFFFAAVPLSFYAMLAVGFTFLLSIDKLPFIGPGFRGAIRRARETGRLDGPDARPLQSALTGKDAVEPGYRAAAWEFGLPLLLVVGIAAGSFVMAGEPALLWAFGAGVGVAYLTSRLRGMSWRGLGRGFTAGMAMVGYAALILVLAVAIGAVSRATGGGLFLIEMLGGEVGHLWLPMGLFAISVVIALATGSSWGTFAVMFPLAMPLAWAVAEGQGLGQPVLFLQICFAAVLNGGVCGDQCSPISDTSVMSSLATGCDLMDHIRTQLVPCAVAGGLAAIGWTVMAMMAR